MIAVIGKYGSGKTTFLKKIEKYGYKVLYTDDFYKECYAKNGVCVSIIKEKLGINFIKNDEVNKEEIRNFILNDKGNINKLEQLVYPVLEEHLSKYKYDFVEIPNLFTKNANFLRFFSQILNIQTTEEKRQKNIKKKGVNKKISELNNFLNNGKIGKKVVNISWEDIEKENFFEDFFTTLKIL
ncbi:dephospho-CoA kinase [Mycoplasma sp. Z386]